jgi:hypothetical protein
MEKNSSNFKHNNNNNNSPTLYPEESRQDYQAA